ncbi:stalk domain-containing protein [Paenibacillus tengchongensis]|uniref:C40 family peptidase n=1 Tax=Paenibacillus tengchongensis TaxID=2608684 RepID=UPI00124E9781|nr:stalk domain-containing protein [Paenibacillus tengchongensis]
MTTMHKLILPLLALPLVSLAPAPGEAAARSAAEPAAISIILDGQPFQPDTEPLNMNGTVLVPLRGLFETLGAELSWDNASKTVTAAKGNTTLIYQIGSRAARLNGQTLGVQVPGQIREGQSLIPLRLASEALGSDVAWLPDTGTVRISTNTGYETTIERGVNLRSTPGTTEEPVLGELLPSGSKVHILNESGPLWLKVRTEKGNIGYISAKPKYTDYTSDSLLRKQGEALIAYGLNYTGTPYEFGASPDQTGTFDCSSFVQRIYADALSVNLPRVSYNQAKEGTEAGLDELRTGDLLFFSARGLDIGHVAIYAGNNQILHTYSKEQGVHTEAFDGQWKERFVTARRIL